MNIAIGVDNYRFSLSEDIFVELSFEISGDFLSAALTDDITKTVDYYVLCRQIETALKKLDSHHVQDLALKTRSVMESASTLIKTGNFLLVLHKPGCVEVSHNSLYASKDQR